MPQRSGGAHLPLHSGHVPAWLSARMAKLARTDPARTVRVLRRRSDSGNLALPLFPDLEGAPPDGAAPPAPYLELPHHHEIRATDISLKRLHATLAAAAELAFVAEIVHGAPSRFRDPARFALAHGGKDGHPFPVPLKVYDATLACWSASAPSRTAVDRREVAKRWAAAEGRFAAK